jgi:hypothetical protein
VDLRIRVRIPASQPFFFKDCFETARQLKKTLTKELTENTQKKSPCDSVASVVKSSLLYDSGLTSEYAGQPSME